MNKRVSSSLCAVGALFSLAAGSAMAGATKAPTFTEIAGVREFTGQMIARPVQSNATKRAAGLNALMGDAIEYLDYNDELVFQVPAGMDENSVAKQLMATGNYEYVEPNWMLYPTVTPNDPRYSSQWHHTKIQSPAAWDINTGSTVIVAICDTGCRKTHEDLASNRVSGFNCVSNLPESSGGQTDDVNGHGTNTAGTAAALGNNAKGVSGVGWNLKHMTVRVTDSSGGGAYLADLTQGATWGAQNGARVSSVSYSGVDSSSVNTTGNTLANTYNAVLCWAAGNEGRSISGDYPNVLVVGASTSSDTKASWSNYGPLMDFVAPGVGIWTCTRSSDISYGAVDGTSFSCPMTAGLVALAYSTDSSLSAAELIAVVTNNCDDLGSAGRDNTFGWGRINSFKTLSATGGGPIQLTVPTLNGGSPATISVSNGDANTLTGVYYSLVGDGSTFIAALGVNVDIANAKRIAAEKNTNGSGDASWNVNVPTVPRNTLVWFQAAQSTGNKSSVIATQVNR